MRSCDLKHLSRTMHNIYMRLSQQLITAQIIYFCRENERMGLEF